ncbi:ImmA/IrrE family metallo-endopeptidase [Haloferula chungangensis]|uniref:ImmA/IrrE family metallo-endopeptidase n=1 Tax=Haloferula chungangensis TaxID=1048331 RepID=A0ABW2LCL4_9BACT
MIERSRLKAIQRLAGTTLADNGLLTSLPVRPKEFAKRIGINVIPFHPPQRDISGCLMVAGNTFGIGYSKAIQSEGFQNFTVAHELGHYFIDDHPAAVLMDGKHLSRSGYISKDRYEREADAFAAALLMPWTLIEPIIKRAVPGFEAIKVLSEACESSLVASAIRYCEMTTECVAVIVSHRGAVEFMTASKFFKQLPGLDWLRKREQIPRGVPTHRLGTDMEWVSCCEVALEGSLLNQWFPDAAQQEVEEDVVGLGSYDRTLTVLVTDAAQEEDDDDNESGDDYIDRWKEGRFRPRK